VGAVGVENAPCPRTGGAGEIVETLVELPERCLREVDDLDCRALGGYAHTGAFSQA
jgi:hypothetical protein